MTKALELCEGPGPVAATRCAGAALAAGAKTLIRFGTAGGLSPMVDPGDLIGRTGDYRRWWPVPRRTQQLSRGIGYARSD
ncbi:MAG: hypothetical protein ACPGYL_07310 [Rhodospirillaceae bacterium]